MMHLWWTYEDSSSPHHLPINSSSSAHNQFIITSSPVNHQFITISSPLCTKGSLNIAHISQCRKKHTECFYHRRWSSCGPVQISHPIQHTALIVPNCSKPFNTELRMNWWWTDEDASSAHHLLINSSSSAHHQIIITSSSHHQHQLIISLKVIKNCPKMVQKWSKYGSKMMQNGPKIANIMVQKWSKIGQKMSKHGHKMVQIWSNMIQKWLKKNGLKMV